MKRRQLTLPAGDAHLDVEVAGDGEPVIVIQTALNCHELRPLSERLARAGDVQVVHYHRRGYAGSAPLDRPRSITDEAHDAAAVIRALQAAPAHVVGVSFSAAIALTVASLKPELVQTLGVVEPPPTGTPGSPPFRAANRALQASHARLGPYAALEQFMSMIGGHGWREADERAFPGSVEAMERDAPTFFGSDLPALVSWSFTDSDVAGVQCPVLCLGGAQSGSWFTEMLARLARLLPTVETALVENAGHLVASTHPDAVADALIEHLRRHPRVHAR